MPHFIARITPGDHKAEMYKMQEDWMRQILLPGLPHSEQVSHKPEFDSTCDRHAEKVYSTNIFKEAN